MRQITFERLCAQANALGKTATRTGHRVFAGSGSQAWTRRTGLLWERQRVRLSAIGQKRTHSPRQRRGIWQSQITSLLESQTQGRRCAMNHRRARSMPRRVRSASPTPRPRGPPTVPITKKIALSATSRLDEPPDNSTEFRSDCLAYAFLHERVTRYRVQDRAEVVTQCFGLSCVQLA